VCRRLNYSHEPVQILKFDDSMLKAFSNMSKDVVAKAGSGDDISRKIYASYQQFRGLVMDWSDISERAYLNISLRIWTGRRRSRSARGASYGNRHERPALVIRWTLNGDGSGSA
jgi:hypothetical protein